MAVPVTLALTLLITYLGYTLNRVTLFALIFSIGILVDDAIVVVENIHRHMHLPGPCKPLRQVVVEAVAEVGNPTILATFTVIAAILPMAFVRGLMGPYMRPIPVGASVAMLFSLLIAFVISPWAALNVFRTEAHLPETDASGLHPATSENTPPEPDQDRDAETEPDSRLTLLYRRAIGALIGRPAVRWGFFLGVVVLLAGAMSLVGFGVVKVKMLPFDNKSEFMVQLDLPAGTAREDALALGQDLARRLLGEPVVRDVQVYSGTAAPFTFVGMVRHSFLRQEHRMVDLQVNLVGKGERKEQSHAIAVRLRPELLKLPLPRGHPHEDRRDPARPAGHGHARGRSLRPERGGADAPPGRCSRPSVAWTGWWTWTAPSIPPAPRCSLVLDREKAALHGVAPAQVIQTLYMAGPGPDPGQLPRAPGAPPRCRWWSSWPASQRQRPGPDPAAHRARGARCGAPVRTGAGPGSTGEPGHLPQEPDAGDLRVRGSGRRHREPGLCPGRP